MLMRENALFFILVLLIPVFCSCAAARFALVYASTGEKKAGELRDGVYLSEHTNYRIAHLGENWSRVPLSEGDLMFYNRKAELVITVNSDCGKRYSDIEATSDSLTEGLSEKKVKLRRTVKVGRSTGLYTEYDVTSGGQNLGLATAVHRSGRCDYDFSYFAPVSVFSENLGLFMDFISDFEELGRR